VNKEAWAASNPSWSRIWRRSCFDSRPPQRGRRQITLIGDPARLQIRLKINGRRKNSRINRSTGTVDFSLLTDGLRAEREQGITIDVAYRYFERPAGNLSSRYARHEQYTRNMATGASTANLAVILIDSTKGVLAQPAAHLYCVAAWTPNVLVAINKMDSRGVPRRRLRASAKRF